jgi:putative membrane protein
MTRLRFLGALTLLGLCFGLVPLVTAQDRRAEKKPVGDARFVCDASAAGLAEVNFGMLAEKRAANAEVRRFAHRMVTDHSKANAELLRLANEKKWEPAPTMDRQHQAGFDRLSQMTGRNFDRAYVESQVKDHEKAVSLFENASKNAEDSQLKAWASRTLPTLRDHLKMARDLEKGKSDRDHNR